MPVALRPYAEADLPALVAINDEAHPAVPITPAEELARLIAMSRLTLVAELGFVEVGRQQTKGGTTEVALLARPVGPVDRPVVVG